MSVIAGRLGLGAAVLADIDRSFGSRAEASKFFSTKGFEYLIEHQPDTAAVRFNLAWVLDPLNADAYRGLAVIQSQRPDVAPDVVQRLLLQGLAVAPTNAPLLADAAVTGATAAPGRAWHPWRPSMPGPGCDQTDRALRPGETSAIGRRVLR